MARTRTSPTGTPGRRVALDGILVALAMLFSYIETFIPFNFGVPGIKLGLANLIVLLGLTFLPALDVLLISVVRILLSSLLFGNVMSLWYSLAGGLLSFVAMYLASRNFWSRRSKRRWTAIRKASRGALLSCYGPPFCSACSSGSAFNVPPACSDNRNTTIVPVTGTIFLFCTKKLTILYKSVAFVRRFTKVVYTHIIFCCIM